MLPKLAVRFDSLRPLHPTPQVNGPWSIVALMTCTGAGAKVGLDAGGRLMRGGQVDVKQLRGGRLFVSLRRRSAACLFGALNATVVTTLHSLKAGVAIARGGSYGDLLRRFLQQPADALSATTPSVRSNSVAQEPLPSVIRRTP